MHVPGCFAAHIMALSARPAGASSAPCSSSASTAAVWPCFAGKIREPGWPGSVRPVEQAGSQLVGTGNAKESTAGNQEHVHARLSSMHGWWQQTNQAGRLCPCLTWRPGGRSAVL